MNRINIFLRQALRVGLLAAAAALAACSGGDDDSPEPPPPSVGSATVGAAGGTVQGPDGVRLQLPANAVASDVTFRIARDSAGAPPLPAGVELASAIYAITPHGTAFEAAAAVQIPIDAARAAGRTTFLMKASPDGTWSVLVDSTTTTTTTGTTTSTTTTTGTAPSASARRAAIASLSYLAVGVCSVSEPGGLFAQACPGGHTLAWTLLDSSGAVIPVQQDESTGATPPVLTVTTPTTLNLRMTYTRPAGINRIDRLDTGTLAQASGGLVLLREPGITFSASAPRWEEVNSSSFTRTFTVAIDPARVNGAGNANGTVRRLRAQVHAAQPAAGVFGGAVWDYDSFIPIRVRHVGVLPSVTPPLPANPSVAENNSFTLQSTASGANNLGYEWRYYNNAQDTAVRAAEGTNNLPLYTSPAAPLAWNGRLYYVHVCGTSGTPAVSACVDSLASPLTVTAFAQLVAFTSQPAARDIVEGEGTTFVAAATGTPSPTLRWHLGVTCRNQPLLGRSCSGTPLADGAGSGALQGANISGSGSGTLTLATVPLSAHGSTVALQAQQAGIANASWSEVATLSVRVRPLAAGFVQQLMTPRTVQQGSSVDFSAVVSGTEPVNRLWAINGTAVNDGPLNSGACAGASVLRVTPDVLRLSNVPLLCDGAVIGLGIDNVATPAGQRITSTAQLFVTPLAAAPVFTMHPASATVDANLATAAGSASFSFALAAGNGSLGWQWLVNGLPLANGSGLAANGVLQTASVSGASGTLGAGATGTLTLSQVPLAANGATLSVQVTRTVSNQSAATTSQGATLSVNPGVVGNALTATQVVAGYEWSLVLRPDRTVWAWGWMHRDNGTVQIANLPPANQMLRPQQMYPTALSDVHAVAGWYDSFWALKGTPGTHASRVLQWGNARDGADGRGTDGNGSITGAAPQSRYNEAAPVEVLERVSNVAQPVDRICAIAGGASRLLMIRAISAAGATTDCNAGTPKTVWLVGSMTPIPGQSSGVAYAMPGLPTDSPPAQVFFGQTSSGSPPLVIALEDGRLFAHGSHLYNGLGMPLPLPGSGQVGSISAPQQLPAGWGSARSLGMSFYYALFAVRADGTVVTSGYNNANELGLGALVQGTVTNGPVPLLAESCSSNACADMLTGVSAIASNNVNTTLALKNGQLLGWGSHANGLLGVSGSSGNQPYPRSLTASPTGLTALSSSNAHALVIGPGNVVYSWGSGLRGALGDGVDGSQRLTPQAVLR